MEQFQFRSKKSSLTFIDFELVFNVFLMLLLLPAVFVVAELEYVSVVKGSNSSWQQKTTILFSTKMINNKQYREKYKW